MWKSLLKNVRKNVKKHLHYVRNGAKLMSVDNKNKNPQTKRLNMNNQATKTTKEEMDYEVIRLVKKSGS